LTSTGVAQWRRERRSLFLIPQEGHQTGVSKISSKQLEMIKKKKR